MVSILDVNFLLKVAQLVEFWLGDARGCRIIPGPSTY